MEDFVRVMRFHSPPGVLFTFPSQYCFTIGHRVVFRLRGWAPYLLTGFLVSADTLDSANASFNFAYKTITSFGRSSHTVRLQLRITCAVHTPPLFLTVVWPFPLSLATTHRISFDFSSSGYLDVSVPRVPYITLWIHVMFYDSSS